MRCRGKGDAIPLLAVKDAPRLAAGSFTIAPVTGFIHLLPVKTVGAVVTTAQPVVGIVPEGTPLEVNAIVMNKDIVYIREGHRCIVKVDTFDFQKYGTIEGKVQVVNPYSMDEKDNKEKTNEAESESDGYPVRVKVLSETLKTRNGDEYKIKPGMSVTAEVNVGKCVFRRMSPLDSDSFRHLIPI